MILRLPRGYHRLEGVSPLAVAHDDVADAIREILRARTLHQWAAEHPQRWEYRGRGPVFSAPLPADGAPRVVVRHARRGGLIARLLRDLYLPPTPAASELLISAILRGAGVPTPSVLAFATYRAPWPFRRVDVMSVEVDGQDLATVLAKVGPQERRALTVPVATLIGRMVDAGAWHQDLNAKNILLASHAGEPLAVLLDVDRVRFTPGGPHVRDANLARLRRSVEKARRRGEGTFSVDDWSHLEGLVRADEASRTAARSARAMEAVE